MDSKTDKKAAEISLETKRRILEFLEGTREMAYCCKDEIVNLLNLQCIWRKKYIRNGVLDEMVIKTNKNLAIQNKKIETIEIIISVLTKKPVHSLYKDGVTSSFFI